MLVGYQRTAFNFLNWLRAARNDDEINTYVRMISLANKKATFRRGAYRDFLRFFNSEVFGIKNIKSNAALMAGINRVFNQLESVPHELTESQYRTVLLIKRAFKLIPEDEDPNIDERLFSREYPLYTYFRLSAFRNTTIDEDIRALASWGKYKYINGQIPTNINIQCAVYFTDNEGSLQKFSRSSTRGIYPNANIVKTDILQLFEVISNLLPGYNLSDYEGAKVKIFWNRRRR